MGSHGIKWRPLLFWLGSCRPLGPVVTEDCGPDEAQHCWGSISAAKCNTPGMYPPQPPTRLCCSCNYHTGMFIIYICAESFLKLCCELKMDLLLGPNKYESSFFDCPVLRLCSLIHQVFNHPSFSSSFFLNEVLFFTSGIISSLKIYKSTLILTVFFHFLFHFVLFYLTCYLTSSTLTWTSIPFSIAF